MDSTSGDSSAWDLNPYKIGRLFGNFATSSTLDLKQNMPSIWGHTTIWVWTNMHPITTIVKIECHFAKYGKANCRFHWININLFTSNKLNVRIIRSTVDHPVDLDTCSILNFYFRYLPECPSVSERKQIATLQNAVLEYSPYNRAVGVCNLQTGR